MLVHAASASIVTYDPQKARILADEELDVEFRRSRFPEHLGIGTIRASDGRAQLALRQEEFNTNAVHTIHGGAIAALIDLAVTAAARSVSADVSLVLTISLTINYLMPATGDVVAEASVISSSRRLASVKADVLSLQGELLATSLAQVRLLREKA